MYVKQVSSKCLKNVITFFRMCRLIPPIHGRLSLVSINACIKSCLNHAGHDALCFKDYLIACGVSCDHICLLVDDGDEGGALHPTRKGILDALHDLRDNSKIKHGDMVEPSQLEKVT
jgi:hypothetical protein